MPRAPLFTRDFVLLLCAHFLQALGFASLLLLPLYLEHLGASRTQIGVLMSLQAVGGLASRPLVGWALDALGRKPTLLAGTAVLVASMGGLHFVHDLGPLIYVNRVAFGIGAGTLFTGYFTWASDLIPEARRTEGIALFGVSGLLPIGLNAFVSDLGLAAPDLRLLFSALAGVIATSFVFLLLVPEAARGGVRSVRAREVIAALKRAPLRPAWLATVLFAGLVGVFFTFSTVTAQARGVPDPPQLWLAYAFGAVGVRLVGARLPDRLGNANLVAPALASYLGAFILLGTSHTSGGFLLAGLLGGLGHGYCFPIVVSQVVTRSPPALRGSAMAMFTAVWQASELALPPIAGALADRASDGVMFQTCVLVALAGLALWTYLEHAHGPPSGRSVSPPAAPPG